MVFIMSTFLSCLPWSLKHKYCNQLPRYLRCTQCPFYFPRYQCNINRRMFTYFQTLYVHSFFFFLIKNKILQQFFYTLIFRFWTNLKLYWFYALMFIFVRVFAQKKVLRLDVYKFSGSNCSRNLYLWSLIRCDIKI